jgi:hypothetical protein
MSSVERSAERLRLNRAVLASEALTLSNDRHGVTQKRDQFFPIV